MRVLGLIPARGGSKGVKRKNVKLLDGKPLISYAIECAQASEFISTVAVTSDDEEIIEVASTFEGVEVIKRPNDLAQDTSSVVPVVEHALKYLDEQFDFIVLLQPTAPIRTGVDVDNVLKLFGEDTLLEAVISVIPMDDVHPSRMYVLESDASLLPFTGEAETARRQELEPVYYRNGCIYAVRTEVFIKQKTLMPPRKKAYVMPADWLANIDSPRDWIVTEALVKAWKKGELCD